MNGGHYYAHVKNFSNKWTCYNDHRCFGVDDPEDVITKKIIYYFIDFNLQNNLLCLLFL